MNGPESGPVDISKLSGEETTEALLHMVEGNHRAVIVGKTALSTITAFEHRPPDTINVTAKTVSGQIIAFTYGAGDKPVINLRRFTMGQPTTEII